MIRKRIPRRDDQTIYELVQLLLVPFALETQPDLRVDLAAIRKRLKPCLTYVDTCGRKTPGGFVSLRMEKDKMYVDMLAVHPRWQGKGVGSRLLEQAERTAVLEGYREVTLWVDDTNVQAQHFYKAKGYEAVHYDTGIRCYMLTKRLQAQRPGLYR
ncbi:GNAT family N-acetyltransferase [Paenibacillus sp. TAB 01]|uniref:GNAT family N-acetyltransferase n=1 Tax=Paenibacillus sp. TAB 01 TaxID=3368988 RepID=UPI003751D9A6